MSNHRSGALLGLLAPFLFLIGVVAVSWGERDFMNALGWDVWPSGTALGPLGWMTVLTFVITGLCLMVFAWSLFLQAGTSRVRRAGAGLLLVSGAGMAMLAFNTDPPGRPATWHGTLHFGAYLAFVLGLLLADVFLAWGSWKRLGRTSWKFAPLALVPWLGVLAIPDGLAPSSYLFFAVLFTPLLVLALRVLADGLPIEPSSGAER